MKLIAKSATGESIEEHTGKLIEALECIKNQYGACFEQNELALILFAAKYHDCGKANYSFQKLMYKKRHIPFPEMNEIDTKELDKLYSQKDSKSVPHGYLSPAFIDIDGLSKNYTNEEIKVLINAIINHHERDYPFNSEELRQYIIKDLKKRFTYLKFQKKYLRFKYNNEIDDDTWIEYAKVKGMLNRLDYWASSNASYPIEITNLINGKNITQIVYEKLTNKYPSLRDVQTYMYNHQCDNVIAIASTGSGKTEAALLWLGNVKGFYTLPLKVSINAIYERIKKEYRYPGDNITLLHSDALSYLLENEQEDSINKYTASRSFSYPITVCTVDQLFKFIYKYKGSEILLATLRYSKVIIDEIQAYSPDIIAKLIYGLKMITKAGGKFAIITATFPPVLQEFMTKECIEFEPPVQYLSKLVRHKIKYTKDDFDYAQIVKDSNTKKVLIICNTVKSAQTAYQRLKNLNVENINMIHARYIQRDRHILETEILKFAADKEAIGVWISTQIVEASLDIDFDKLYTHMCTADSLLQRMGRCFRLRNYDGLVPNIIICDTGEGVSSSLNSKKAIYDKYIYDRSVDYLQQYNNKVFTEEMKIQYINTVYDARELKGTEFYETIRRTIKECKENVPGIYDRQLAEKNLRDITSTMVIPQTIYDKENEYGRVDELINTIETSSDTEAVIVAQRKLNELTLSIPYMLKEKSREPISKTLKIYTTPLKYNFDNEKNTGLGLIREVEEFNNYL